MGGFSSLCNEDVSKAQFDFTSRRRTWTSLTNVRFMLQWKHLIFHCDNIKPSSVTSYGEFGKCISITLV